MQRVMITSPFTGLEFEAIKYADGRIVATDVISGKDIQITYNPSIKRYMLPADCIKHVPLLTMDEAAEMLDISKARVSVLAKQNRLVAVRPGASLYLTRESVLEYRYRQNKEQGAKDGTGID